MAALNANDRAAVVSHFCSDISSLRELIGINKTQLAAAIAAADDWIEANAASYNSALPTAARNNLTASQKSRLLTYVIRKRFDQGS